MANRKTLICLFALAVIIEAMWWGFMTEPKLSLSLKNLGIQQERTIGKQKPRVSTNSESTTESEATPQRHKTTLVTTASCGQYYLLLILVSSTPNNILRRRDIRKTWGVDYAIKPRWKTAFLVARTQIQTEFDYILTMEDAFHGDLVRANYYENYWNQTLKVQMGFEWAARYCKFSFLLKIDDDVFVNTEALISHLGQPNIPRQKLYMGNQIKSPFVFRYGKWEVSFEEYNRSHYPDYCSGFGYVLSADIVALFVDLFGIVPKFRIDDVYVGMLAEKAGVKIIHNGGFIVGPQRVTECVLHNDTLVWHGVIGKCLLDVFNQTLKETNFTTTVHHFQLKE